MCGVTSTGQVRKEGRKANLEKKKKKKLTVLCLVLRTYAMGGEGKWRGGEGGRGEKRGEVD